MLEIVIIVSTQLERTIKLYLYEAISIYRTISARPMMGVYELMKDLSDNN